MDLGIGWIGELQRDKVAVLASQLLSIGNGALHAQLAWCEYHLCTVCTEQRRALCTHTLGHDQDQAIPFHCGNHGKSDARIATCGFHNDTARFEQPCILGCLDHRPGDAVLNTPTRVESLQLGPHLCCTGCRKLSQADHRRVADEVQDRFRSTRRHQRSASWAVSCHVQVSGTFSSQSTRVVLVRSRTCPSRSSTRSTRHRSVSTTGSGRRP